MIALILLQPEFIITQEGTATNRDVADLNNELETQRQRLEMCFQTNPGVIEQYERRKNEIENLSQKLADRQRKADKIDRQIKSARVRACYLRRSYHYSLSCAG